MPLGAAKFKVFRGRLVRDLGAVRCAATLVGEDWGCQRLLMLRARWQQPSRMTRLPTSAIANGIVPKLQWR